MVESPPLLRSRGRHSYFFHKTNKTKTNKPSPIPEYKTTKLTKNLAAIKEATIINNDTKRKS